ncbi:adhesin [Streptomyces sp. NPDC000410]|uniref:adhesin n=1 Tax=Streptomyces sp. NPDC000410 TaxID=3154254 RepID=UPI0033258D41
MACERCGSESGGAGGGTRGGARRRGKQGIPRLSRYRKVLYATGAAVVLGCFIAAVALLTGSDADGDAQPPADAAADDDFDVGGVPTRIGPTALPGVDEWAGPGCSTGHYSERGRTENGDAAWYTVRSGGQRDGDCDGSFTAVPMSGSPTKDGGATAIWSWDLDEDYEKCSLAVYVPASARAADVAGDPTFYRVLADPRDTGSGYTGFGVRQTAHRGSLVSVGSYPVKGGDTFAVQLLDRGRDWGDASRTGAHHAAAQMRLTCSP